MLEEKFLSLYDYLKRAAGSELGKQVATRAAELNVGFKTRHVSNAKYTGEIMLYPESFLKWYFKTPDADEMRKNKMNNKMNNKKHSVLSLSGGLDSSTLLLHLLANGYEVTALSFDYGQKHSVELERAQALVEYINAQHNIELYLPPFPRVKHQVIKLEGLVELLNSALVTGGADVPEGHYAEENMKATVVPNRNKIFSSLIQAVALSIATTGEKKNVDIALGIHKGDESVYPDCRAEFRDADLHTFKVGNWDSELVNYYTPYLEVMKYDILKDGAEACDKLGLNFNEVYKRTNTSYKPYPSGNSDYKSASSVERIEAFIKLGRPDPVQYEDESGEVSWDIAKSHVEQVLNKWENR